VDATSTSHVIRFYPATRAAVRYRQEDIANIAGHVFTSFTPHPASDRLRSRRRFVFPTRERLLYVDPRQLAATGVKGNGAALRCALDRPGRLASEMFAANQSSGHQASTGLATIRRNRPVRSYLPIASPAVLTERQYAEEPQPPIPYSNTITRFHLCWAKAARRSSLF
jgi:hypothetical protein